MAVADISGNGQPDLLVLRVDAVPNGPNAGWYRIGWNVDAAGQVTGWSPWLPVPDWFPWLNAGGRRRGGRCRRGRRAGPRRSHGGRAGRPQARATTAAARSTPDGTWSRPGEGGRPYPTGASGRTRGRASPSRTSTATVRRSCVVLAVDNPAGQNGGYYSVGWRLAEGRAADGWGPWQAVPDWRFWEGPGAAAAVAPLGRRGHAPSGPAHRRQPPGTQRRLVPGPRPDDRPGHGAADGRVATAGERLHRHPVHAALLHTGSVVFFSGSGQRRGPAHRASSSRRRSGITPTPSYSQPPHAGGPVLLRPRVSARRPAAGQRRHRAVRPVLRAEAGGVVRPRGRTS